MSALDLTDGLRHRWSALLFPHGWQVRPQGRLQLSHFPEAFHEDTADDGSGTGLYHVLLAIDLAG